MILKFVHIVKLNFWKHKLVSNRKRVGTEKNQQRLNSINYLNCMWLKSSQFKPTKYDCKNGLLPSRVKRSYLVTVSVTLNFIVISQMSKTKYSLLLFLEKIKRDWSNSVDSFYRHKENLYLIVMSQKLPLTLFGKLFYSFSLWR